MTATGTRAVFRYGVVTIGLAAILQCLLVCRADARVPSRYVVVKKRGEGGNAKVYVVKHSARRDPVLGRLSLLRVIKRNSTARGVHHAPRKLRHQWAREAVETRDFLQQHPAYRQRFGEILTPALLVERQIAIIRGKHKRTLPARSGVMLQAEGVGVRYKKLSADLKAVARDEVNAAADLAEQLLPRSPVTGQRVRYSRNYRGNYLFDPTSGKIASCFDHISDALRSSR